MKDARWAVANSYADSIGLDYEHFTYGGWQELLNRAQGHLDAYPYSVEFWASRFGAND